MINDRGTCAAVSLNIWAPPGAEVSSLIAGQTLLVAVPIYAASDALALQELKYQLN